MGHLQSESAVTFGRNDRSRSNGISGQLGPEYALEAIADWIAADNPKRAAAFANLLRERCLQLVEMPRAFPLVPRYESLGIRRRPVGDYLIFYRLTDRVVEVLHVLHGARDYEGILFPN